ncbi:MAG: LysR family transcriptional regulator [Pseudomonadota bacterium]
MRLEELELFRRAAALGNLSAAGRELGLSPATASARLQSLERSLGASLFVRTTRRITLTEEGEHFLAHAEKALDALEMGRASIRGADAAPAGTLRASIPGPFGRRHVLPYLTEFLDANPEVELDLHISDEIVNIVEGGYELAIRIGPLNDSGLLASKLAPNRRIVVASPSYLERNDAPSVPEDLGQHVCLLHGDTKVWRFHRAGEERAVRVSGRLHTNSGSVTRDAAIHGLGVALKGVWDVGEDLQKGRLVHLLPDWELGDVGAIWALRPASKFASPRARAFVDFLRSKYGATPYWEIE